MFQYDGETRTITDEASGERLRGWGHHQDPYGHVEVIDREGSTAFECLYSKTFDQFDDEGRGIVLYTFVSGKVLNKSAPPDRADAACQSYFRRIGNYLVAESLSKTNVRSASWQVSPSKSGAACRS